VNPRFWAGKRVLISGHTGFKGSWLSLWLQSLGAELQGFALTPSTKPNLFELANIGRGMASELADIRDYEAVHHCIYSFKPEIVFHLAAQPLVSYSYKRPVETYSTNVLGAVHLLEAVRLVGSAKVVVNVTTDKCYENKEWQRPYREDEPMGGYDPYSSSKGCSELVTSAYRRSYFAESGIGLASARAGNVIGGGDWAENRLVPDFFRSIEAKMPIAIRNPRATRPWQHVLEPLSGYMLLAERLWDEPVGFASGWNFGPDFKDIKPVSWVIDRLVTLWGEKASWICDGGEHFHEAQTLALDISKAKNELKWSPRLGLEQALEMIVHWEKARRDGYDMRAVSLQQIDEFLGNIL
jgi:CDP-glucose 4,6-dehydratase